MEQKYTPETLKQLKKDGTKIVMLSVPDYYSAKIADEQGAHCVLVGDSLGRYLQGDEDAFSVTVGDIVYYTRIVNRAVEKALLIADMPYSSYSIGPDEAITNAKYLIERGGATAVKLQGGKDYLHIVEAVASAGIPIMGHVGLRDTFYQQLGGLPLRADQKNPDWDYIIDITKKLEKAGAFAVLLECIPCELGKIVQKNLDIPVIGLGAGKHVDGHSMIFHEMMTFHEGPKPKYVKRYAHLAQIITSSIKEYVDDVKALKFPSEDNEY
jgi:3-methyl-2-oxobutanoate hydroxymethyltransferase